MTHKKQLVDQGLTRAPFTRDGISKLRGTEFAAPKNAASMCDKLKWLFIVVIVFISLPALAFGQQSASSSLVPPTKLIPPAHGKIPVAFIIGRDLRS